MGKIEAESIGIDQRTLLGNVVAEYRAQRGMQQVGRGMVAGRSLAGGAIHLGSHRISHFEAAGFHLANV